MADTAVLEKILHVKEKEKDAAQLDKTEAVNRFEEIASRLYEELKRKENAESELDVVMKAKATITMIKEQSRYISLMKEKINTLQNNVQKARIEMEQKQNALTEAHIEVKKIEQKSKLWVVLGILIPVIMLAIVVAALIFILDSDKGREKLSNVPVISTFISDDANGISKNDHSTSDKSGKVIAKQKEEIEELEREIASLEDIVDDQDKEIKKLEKSKEGKADNDDDEEEVDEVKQTASSFRKMDPEKAAKIVENLDKSTAIEVLEKLSGDVRGGILAEMDAKKAAELTDGMINE